MFPVKSQHASRMQLRMDFEPGLLDQYKSLRACVVAVVYSSRAGLDGCAAACDVSPSTLSKMLNRQRDAENERHLPLDFIVTIMEVTKDYRPLLWLAAKFMPDDGMRHEAAVSTVEQMLPQLVSALEVLKAGQGKR